jgi:hypothetical protein
VSGEFGLIGALLAMPAVVFLVLYFVLRRRAVVAGVVTAVLGAAAGAFLASAGSAMATSVNPNDAMLQGAAIGFAGSAVVAVAIGVLLRVMRL